jgi:FMN-dependent oxidoreductase (nitrilotriacetate monooxygenase family)
MRSTLMFNMFAMDTPGHLHHGLWRHPENRSHEHNSLKYWLDYAKFLEEAKFDAIFLADVPGMYPTWQGSRNFQVRNAIQFPVSDPMALVSGLAAVTSNLSFIVTSSVIQHPPFTFARYASTLDHLTEGRFGWNIVTSFLDNAAKNVGLSTQVEHDERYRWADEYVDVVYKLWEGSWEDDALLVDRETGTYADPAKIHLIDHVGPRYTVPGPHMVPPSPQRTPVLFQAGTSPAGRAFAAHNAEGIFVASPTRAASESAIADIKKLARNAGRDPEAIHFLQGLTFIVGSTEEEARRKEAALDEYIDPEAMVANNVGSMGLDLGDADMTEPLTEVVKRVPGVRGWLQAFIDSRPPGSAPTLMDLAKQVGKHRRVTGTPEQIADELVKWRDVGITGINVMSMLSPGTYTDFAQHVAPVLQRRGLMQSEYAPGTLREKMFPGTGPALPESHPARKNRRVSSSSS